MTSTDPQRGTRDLSRQLHQAAYPGSEPAWIEERVATTEARIGRAMQARPSTAEGARRPSDVVLNHAAPRRRTTRQRIILGAGLGAVAVAAAVLGIAERRWVAEAAISTIGITGLLAAAAVAITGMVASVVRARRERVLSCRVRIDAPFGVDVGETVRLESEHHAVADPGVVVVRIKNTGGAPLRQEDYVSPLSLYFPGRTVVSVDVTEFEPPVLERVLAGLGEAGIEHDRVKLPAVPLQPDDSFKLVIVLSGTKPGTNHQVVVEGGLREGRITTHQGREKIRPGTLVWGGLTALCAGAFAVVLLLNNVTPFTKLPEGVVCAPGALSVEGSTAFSRAATALAGSYGAYCPEASVKVRAPGSREGLERLVAAGKNRARQLGLSDGRFDDPQFRELVAEPLAIVPFTFVASADVPVGALSAEDAQRIFTGTARTWSDITHNPRDTGTIRVVGRSTDSGTRQALEKYVLSGNPDAPVRQAAPTSDSCREPRQGVPSGSPIVCEQGSTGDLVDRVANLDGAIGYASVSDVDQAAGVKKITLDGREGTFADIREHGYPFWTVEYVYSLAGSEPGSLAGAFKNFLFTPESQSALATFRFYACADDAGSLCLRR